MIGLVRSFPRIAHGGLFRGDLPSRYNASAFHAFDLGGASVCAMGAIEEGFSAEDVVFDVLDHLAGPPPTSTVSTSQNG